AVAGAAVGAAVGGPPGAIVGAAVGGAAGVAAGKGVAEETHPSDVQDPRNARQPEDERDRPGGPRRD
ncbi:MAG TPA: hypothetical protein VF121_16360, partial [Thermoanaerobaculia bacterium]|nr:hypothetical protein [Thermoanaerobaculia bacterium]